MSRLAYRGSAHVLMKCLIVLILGYMASDSKLTGSAQLDSEMLTPVVIIFKLISSGETICIMSANTYELLPPNFWPKHTSCGMVF